MGDRKLVLHEIHLRQFSSQAYLSNLISKFLLVFYKRCWHIYMESIKIDYIIKYSWVAKFSRHETSFAFLRFNKSTGNNW